MNQSYYANKGYCPRCGACDFDYRHLTSNSPTDYPFTKHRFDKICKQCGHSASGRNPDETELNFAKEQEGERKDKLMKLDDIMLTEDDIKSRGYIIQNNRIRRIRISINEQSEKCVRVTAYYENDSGYFISEEVAWSIRVPVSNCNLVSILSSIPEILGLKHNDGVCIESIINVPCRLVYDLQGKNKDGYMSRCVGFGHFMKDKFVMISDIMRVDE